VCDGPARKPKEVNLGKPPISIGKYSLLIENMVATSFFPDFPVPYILSICLLRVRWKSCKLSSETPDFAISYIPESPDKTSS
jgi:hypothetical protein